MVGVSRMKAPSSVQAFGLVTLAAALTLGILWWRADSFASLWLTADQRGRVAYERKDFAGAAEQFTDPRWLGVARYSSGQYLESAQAFALDATATGIYNRGVALLKAREYRQAISAFELAVAETPDWPEAQSNLELARHILDYLESAREQSGTDGKLGADEYRYDASADRGESAVIRDASEVRQQSAEKWMRSVDTETSEFLGLRFALEANRSPSP